MQDHLYQFTVQRRSPKGAKGITFYVTRLQDVERRLKERYVQFGIPYHPKGGQAAHLLAHPELLGKLAGGKKR